MIGKEVVNNRPVCLAEVLEILEKRSKEEELKYEQRLDFDYAQKFCKLKAKKASKLLEKLTSLGLTLYQAVLLVDLMPEKEEEINLIFAKEKNKPDEKVTSQILELLDQFRE